MNVRVLLTVLLAVSFAPWTRAQVVGGAAAVQEVGVQLDNIRAIRATVGRMEQRIAESRDVLQSLEQMEQESRRIAFELNRMKSLTQHGQLISEGNIQAPWNAMPVDSPVRFNPATKNFEAGNFDFVGSLWVSADDVVDTVLIPPRWVKPFEGTPQTMQRMAQAWEQEMGTLVGKQRMLRWVEPLANFWQLNVRSSWKGKVYERFMQLSLIPDNARNAVLRPFDPLDSFYMRVPAVQFFTLNGAPHYHPITGIVNNELVFVDLNNSISSGFSQAIDRHNQTNPRQAQPNPYRNYAARVGPGLRQMILSNTMPIGTIPSDDQLVQALSVTEKIREEWSERLSSVVPLFPELQPGQATPQWVVSVGLSEEDESRYVNRVLMAQDRLKQVTRQINTENTIADYTRNILASLATLLKEAQNLSERLSSQNSIPELSLLMRSVQEDMAVQQRNMSDILRSVEQLQVNRHTEILDLMKEVRSARESVQQRGSSYR